MGGLTGLLAGPAGLVGGVIGGAVLGHIGSEAARNPRAFATPWESEREYEEDEDEYDGESSSESDEDSGNEKGSERKTAKQRQKARQKARRNASRQDAADDDFVTRLGGHLKKRPAKPKTPALSSSGSAAAAAPAPIPQTDIDGEVQRIMGIIEGSQDEGDHLHVLSQLPAIARLRIHARLRNYHNQTARGAHNRRYYVGTDLSRGIHVTIHKWTAAGDTYETTANYHIELS